MSWWRQQVTGQVPMVVEVEKGSRVPEMTPEVARSIGTLQGHPGFQYLLAKLKFHRAVLQSQHNTVRHKTVADGVVFQAGLAWSGWLQHELEQAIAFQSAPPTAPNRTEQTLFEEAQRQLEVLR